MRTKYKCKYCERKQGDVMLILDLVVWNRESEWDNWCCLECLLSRDAQEWNDTKETNKIIKFYTEVLKWSRRMENGIYRTTNIKEPWISRRLKRIPYRFTYKDIKNGKTRIISKSI